MGLGDGTVKIMTELDESGLKSGLSSAASKVGSFAQSGFKVMAGAVAATATAVAGLAAKSYEAGAAFETSMTKASTLFGDTAVDVDNLNDKILKISSDTGVAASEMGEALYSALSAGIPVSEDMAEATAVLEKSAKLAKAGFTDVDTALAATAKTLNAYNLGVEATDDIQKILIQTQNLGITTVGELGASLAQVTPTAAAFNVSFDQVGASLAGMTAAGTPTAQATTQLNSLIAELGKNGTVAAKNLAKAAEGSEYAGMSFSEMMGAGATLQDVLDMLGAEAEKSGVSLVDMFSSIEAGKAALSIDGSDFVGNLAAMSTEADVVGEAFDKMNNTMESQVGRMKTTLSNLGISMYNSVGGPLADVAKMGADMVQTLSDAFNENGFAGLAEAGGTVVAQLVTKISEAAPTLVEASVTILQSLLRGLQENLPTIVQGAMDTISSFAQGIVSMAPTLLQMGMDIITQIVQGIDIPTMVERGVELLNNFINGMVSQLPNLVQMAVDMIIQFAQSLADNLPTIVESGITLLVSLVEGLLQALPQLEAQLPVIIGKIAMGLIRNIPQLLTAAIRIMIAIGKYMVQSLSNLISFIPRIITGIRESFSNTDWASVGHNIMEGIKNGIIAKVSDLVNSAKEAAKNVIDSLKGAFDIHSPSVLMRDLIGKNIMAGIGVGIDYETPNVIRMAQKDMQRLIWTIKAEVSSVSMEHGVVASQSVPEQAAVPGNTVNNYNFYQPIETPDQVAREIRKVNTFGLAGA